MSKLINIEQAVNLINDGDTVAFGGNVLHRAPMAMVREIIRQKKKQLKVIKTAGAMDVDMLCLGEAAYSVDAGFVSYETGFGLASFYRKAVEDGLVVSREHACYTVISALRAAQYGIPFMPVKGLINSQLIEANSYFTLVKDPFSQEWITVVEAIKPDKVVLHVHECDEDGNVYIQGPLFEDILMANTGAKVILTTEKIVKTFTYTSNPAKISIPGFLVDSVVHCPKGASPCSCYGLYDIDSKKIKEFKSINSNEELEKYLDSYRVADKRQMEGGFKYERFCK